MSGYSVSYWTANKSTLDAGAAFYIQDTATAIGAALATLTLDSHISKIVVSDGPGTEVSISVSQISSAAKALAILKNPDGTTASVIVSDTAANIGANFAAIGADSQVSSVQISNNAAVTLTGSQVGHNLSAIGKLINANLSAASVIVKDTATNLASYLDSIESVVGNVSSIVVSNNNAMTLTAAQVANDAAALSKVRWANTQTTNLFKVSDTAAHIGANLDALAVNTNITTITISDSAAVSTTLAQITSDAAALGKLVNASGPGYSLAVTDTAAHLSASLDTLGSLGHLATIVVSDSAALTVTVAEITSDAGALAVTTNLGGGAYTLTVADTAAHISAALSALNANSHVANIEVLSGTVGLSSVAALTTDATALGKLHQSDGTTQAQVVVTDTAANVTNAIASLHGNSQIAKIIVSDSASNQVQFGINQLTSFDTDVLNKLYQSDGVTLASVTVADAAYNLTRAALGEIETYAQVDKIIVLSATGNPYVSVAQWEADIVPESELVNPDGSQATIEVDDSGSSIGAVLSNLNFDEQVAKVVVTSGEVTVDAATAGGASALAKLYNTDGTAASVTVSDTASAISSAFDALNGNARVGAIVISDHNNLVLSASQLATDTTALGKVQGAYGVAVVDSATNVSTYLVQIATNGHVDDISLTGGGAQTITVTETQFYNGFVALEVIAGQFTLVVTGVAAGDVGGVETRLSQSVNAVGTTLSIAVVDTAANLTPATLATLASDSHVGSITVSSGMLSLTEAQFVAGLAGLAKIAGAWSVSVSGATVAQVATIETDFNGLGNAGSGSLTIAVNVGSSTLDSATLATLGADSHVASIVASENPLLLSAAQFASNLAGLGKLNGAWSAIVTGAVADVAAIESGFLGLANAANGELTIDVNDSAVNLTAATLVSLGGDSFVGAIAVTSGTLSLTEAQFVSASTLQGINKIAGPYDVSVTGVTFAQMSAVQSAFSGLDNSHDYGTLFFEIADTAANLTNDALETLGANYFVQAITVTSGTLSLSASQFLFGANIIEALSDIAGAWSLMVSGTAVADVASVETRLSTLGNSGNASLSIAVADVASNLGSAALATLGADADVQSIAISSGTLSLTEGQFNAAAVQLGLAKLASYSVNLTAVAAADAASLALAAHVGTLVVSDTAANIQSHFDALNANSKVTSIIISDNAPLAMTAYASTHDSRAIGLLQNANASAVSLTVSDTAADVASYFDQLNAESNISSIVISDDNPLNLSAAQIGDASTIAKISNADSSGVVIDIADTAADISNNLGTLESDIDNLGYVSDLTISDNGAITVSLAELTSDQTALGLLQNANGNPVSLIVEDSAENILDNAVSLAQNSEVTQVLISDNAALQLTVASYQSDAALFAKLGNANASPYVVDIADNATNISGELDALAADPHVQTITVLGNGAIGVDTAQMISDAAVLSKTYNATDSGASTYTLDVTDMALPIENAFNALNTNSRVTGIIVSDSAQNEVRLDVADALTDTTAEGELYQADGTTPASVAVTDVASAIATHFDALNSDAHINSIAVSNSSNAMAISAAQFGADASAIGKLHGSYSLSVSGTGSAIGGALDALEANGHLGAITVTDNQPITVSIAQLTSDAAVIAELQNADHSAAHVIVADTAFDIQGDIVGLNQNTRVDKIVVTDSAANEVTITAGQAASGFTALGELYDADGSTPASVIVSDTASAISNAFGSLNAETSVDKIIVTDSVANSVTLSAAVAVVSESAEQYLFQADGQTAAEVAVSDNAADLSSELNWLNIDPHVGAITITDPANPLPLLASQVANDTTALAEITPAYTIDVTDTSAHVAQNLDALQDNPSIQSITLTDDGAIDVSDATFERDQTVIASLTHADSSPVLVTIVDSTADVSGDLVNLADAVSEIAGITLNDGGTIEIASIAAFTADAPVLSKITGDFRLAVADNNNSINTGGALDALEPYAAAGHLAGLTVDGAGGDLSVTVAQITGDQNVLAVTANGDASAYTLSVNDTYAHIGAALDSLAANSHVDLISISGPSDPMTITAAQYANDTAAFNKFFGSYFLEVTGVTAAQAGIVATAPHVSGVTVSDSGLNVAQNLDALAHVASYIGSVSLTDSSRPTLTVTDAQLVGDAAILSEINVPYYLAVTGVAAADATAIAANSDVASIAISDTSAHVQTNYDALTALGAKISAVGFIDVSPALTLTGSQYDASASLRAALTGSYHLTVTGAAAADAATFAADANVGHVSISDSSTAVQTNFTALNTIASKITSIAFTDDSPTLSLTETQYNASATLRAAFSGSYSLTETNVLVADLGVVIAEPYVTQLAIADTASQVASTLIQLNEFASRIVSISFTDSSPAMTLTESQYLGMASLRAKFQGSYALTVTGVAVADIATISADIHVAHLAISDTSAHVQSNYAALTASEATISSVIFTDSSPTLSLTEAQYNASSALRAGFQGSYTLTVSAVAAADAAGIAADSHVSSLSIADTAAHVQANIGALATLAGEIGAITLTDAQTPTLTLTAAQYAADASTLQKIASPFNLTLTGVAASAVASTITAVGADANVHTLAIAVSDTASHISAALGSLNASVVQSITISDNAPLVFGASAAANGASALGKLVNANASPLSLAVSDTAAHVSANFSALAGISDLTAITISDNGALSLTGAQVLAGAAALSETLNANSYAPTINVADSAAGLEATGVLDALESNVDIGNIVVSGGPLVVTVQQLVADSDAIADMTTSANATVPVTVRDTANNIAASLGFLALDPQVTAIQVSSGGAITLSVAQLNAYLPALSELQGATLTIKDTAAAVQGALDQLQGLGATVGSVVVSNNLPMTLSATKVANDSAALAKLSNRSGAPISYNVTDSATSVMANLSALAARNAQIGAITLTSGVVSVSAATYQADYATLDKIVGGFSLSDVAASVSSLFDQVNADTHLHTITLTDGVTPVLNLSPASASADTTAIADITNPLFEILTSQGGTYYASGTGPNNAQLVVGDSSVHVNEKTATNLEVVGSADVIAAAANTTLALSGNTMTVTAGTGDNVTLLAGTGDLFTGSNDSLTIAGNVGLTLSGSANTIAIGANDTLTLAGPQTLSAAVSGAGALAVASGTLTIASGTTLAMAALSESGSATISALGDLTYAGALSEGANATLTEATGHTLTLNGTSTLSGTVAGAALAISGGATSVAGTTHLSTTTISVQGASTVLNVTGAVSRTGNFSVNGGATVNLSGGNLSLYGTGNSLSAMSLVGAYTLANYAALSVNSVTVGGSAVLWNNANVTQSSTGVVLGDSPASAARIMNQAAGVWNIVDDSGIAAVGASVKVANSGLFEKTAGTGTSAIAATFNSTGAVLVNTGTLAFSGTGDTFGSSISGAGGVSFVGGSATIATGASLSVATFSESGSATQMSIGAITYGGAFTIGAGASISVLSGATLTLDGTSNLAGTLGGAGSFAIDGGTATLAATSKLWGAAWSVQGSSTVLNVSGSSGRVSNFSVGGGATVNLSGGSFNLSGTGNTFANATIVGSNTFANSGTLAVGTATIGGSAVLSNAATLNQSGGTIVLGDSSASTAKLTNATAAIYDITDNSGVASAWSAARFNNAGLFEKTGGTGVSLIAPVFSNTGTITVSAGTLEFAAGYSGAGADTISGAATLAFDAAVGSGATIAFTGSGGDLKLADPHAFAGVISGFDTVGSNDAITLLGSWTSAGFTENSGRTQGVLQLTSGSQTASLAFNGNHANSFHLTANSGSTIVTYG